MMQPQPQSTVAGPPLGILFHSDELDLAALQATLSADRIERRGAASLFADGRAEETPSVLLLDASLLSLATRLRSIPSHIVVVAADSTAEQQLGTNAVLSIAGFDSIDQSIKVMRMAYQLAGARVSALRAERELTRTRSELRELQRIAMALTTERDPNQLLHEILTQAKRLTHSDAG